MQFKDVLRFSTKNFRIHLKRNLMVVVVMGIIFGLIFTVNLWLQGLENYYAHYTSQATSGQVLITATNSTWLAEPSEDETPISREAMVADIEAYGGQILGEVATYGVYNTIILPPELISGVIEIDPSQVPADAAPTLVNQYLGAQLLQAQYPTQTTKAFSKFRHYEEYRSKLLGQTFTDAFGTKYCIVGLAPDSFRLSTLSFQQLERANANPFNILLEMISTTSSPNIVINNGHSGTWDAGELPLQYHQPAADQVLAVFPDAASAYRYFKSGHGDFMSVDFSDRQYYVEVVAGFSPDIIFLFNMLKFVVNIASLILGLIATIVVIFTSIRLVDQDSKNIALYYSLGATKKQIRSVYLCYFFLLMLFALLFAFFLASTIVLAFSLLNQNLLSIQAAVAFGLNERPIVIWYGVNFTTFIIAFAMLILAPLCTLVNAKHLNKTHVMLK